MDLAIFHRGGAIPVTFWIAGSKARGPLVDGTAAPVGAIRLLRVADPDSVAMLALDRRESPQQFESAA